MEKSMSKKVRSGRELLSDEAGLTTVEYVIILALMGVVSALVSGVEHAFHGAARRAA